MSAPRKPAAGGDGKSLPAATRLRMLPMEDREIIFGWCCSEKPLADVRGDVREAYGISLSSDSQLSRFKDWQFYQQRAERLSNTLENFETWYAKIDPTATRESIRDKAMALFMAETAASGDRAGFLKVARLDLDERSAKTKAELKREELRLNREKFTWLQKDELTKALEALHAELKDNPQGLAAFKIFEAAIAKAST